MGCKLGCVRSFEGDDVVVEAEFVGVGSEPVVSCKGVNAADDFAGRDSEVYRVDEGVSDFGCDVMGVVCLTALGGWSGWLGGRCWISFQNNQSLTPRACSSDWWRCVVGKVVCADSAARRIQLRIVWGPQS